nr:uncharacterized protein LOC109177605 [Ipomoea trifida]
MSADDVRLKAEIKRLLREAAALSQPSTFAQAAKLRRIAAAKEKELAKSMVLSWLSGGDAPNYTTIGIIPWIFVSSKASRFLLKRVIK